MTGQSDPRIRVSLLYVQPRPVPTAEMAAALKQVLGLSHLPATEVFLDPPDRLEFYTPGPRVAVLGQDEPLSPAERAHVRRPQAAPARAEMRVARRLDTHRSLLTIEITPGGARQLSGQQLVALANRLLRRLMRISRADLVFWHRSGALFSAEEFLASQAGRPDSRRRAALPPIVDDVRPAAPGLFDGIGLEEAGASDLPDLPSPLQEANDRLKSVFRAVKPELPRDSGLAGAEDASLAARLSVYVMNGTIMVLNFPVGMAMLTYNLLKGEDLTATARVMAVTGTIVGLLGVAGLPGLPG